MGIGTEGLKIGRQICRLAEFGAGGSGLGTLFGQRQRVGYRKEPTELSEPPPMDGSNFQAVTIKQKLQPVARLNTKRFAHLLRNGNLPLGCHAGDDHIQHPLHATVSLHR